ncbi:MAG: hypothetical protein LBL96_06415 [Clostridiales bacterium]|nr:hypothetical protein [Clostridiales bacterium]
MKKKYCIILACLIIFMSFGFTASVAAAENDGRLNDLERSVEMIIDAINNMDTAPALEPTYDPTPTPRPVAPKVKLVGPQTAQVNAGQTLDIVITVRNVGVGGAGSVLASIVAPTDAGLSLSFVDSTNNLGTINENAEKTMRLRIAADGDAKPGNYNVELKYSYRDANAVNSDESDTITIRIVNAGYSSALMLSDFKSQGDIAPGSSFDLGARLINTGMAVYSGLQIAIEGLEPDKLSLTGEGSFFKASVPGRYEENLNYKIFVSKKVATGTYPLTFKLTAKASDGTEVASSFVYYVNVNAGDILAADPANVEITRLTSPEGSYRPGMTFSVEMTIKNNGAATAKSVKLVAEGTEAIVPMSANTRIFNSIPAGESRDITFTFAATAEAKSQNYAIQFSVTYQTGEEGEDGDVTQTVEQYAGVTIDNPPVPTETPVPPVESEKISKPKIIVQEYKTDPGIVKAGQEFDLSLVFKNTHKAKSISNIKIVLTATSETLEKGSVFTPVNCSNTVYIDNIEPQGAYGHKLRMYTVPDASPRTYTISVGFNYEDAEYNEYTEEETIGVNVKQIVKMEIGDFTVPPTVMVGEPVSLYFNIVNSGKVQLSNLRVAIDPGEAEMDLSQANMFIGKLAAGSSAYYDGMFTMYSPGAVAGTIVISGEDDVGEEISMSREFAMTVEDYPVLEDNFPTEYEDVMPEPTGFAAVLEFVKRPVVWIPSLVIVAGIIIAVALRIRFKRLRKQQGMLDE